MSVDDGDHGNRDQQPGAIDADPCHETWCLHTEKILAEHLVHHRGVVGAKKQHVNHDGVRELRSCCLEDRLAIQQRLMCLLPIRRAGELTRLHIHAHRPADVDRIAFPHRLAVTRVVFGGFGNRNTLLDYSGAPSGDTVHTVHRSLFVVPKLVDLSKTSDRVCA